MAQTFKTAHDMPQWLYDLTYGLADQRHIRILLENERFAVVQCPGGKWYDNSGEHYGASSYSLVDKRLLHTYRKSVGLMDCKELQHGGRAKLAQWKRLIEQESLTPRQVRILEIERTLRVGAGAFTGDLTNELEALKAEEAKPQPTTLQDVPDESAEKFRRGDL
jgi:hypothetical protein